MSAYGLNRMMYDLRLPACRQAFDDDDEGYLARYPLTDAEKDLVRRRDWQGLADAGTSVYVLTKIGATLGVGLLEMGAAMRGMSFPEFQGFLAEQNARLMPYALLPEAEGDGHG